MKNSMESAWEIAGKAREIIMRNPKMGATYVEDYLVRWDMERKMIFVTMGKWCYCGHITEDFNFVRWSRERA